MLQDLYWLQNGISLERNDFFTLFMKSTFQSNYAYFGTFRSIVKIVRNYVMDDISKNVSTKPTCVTPL